MDPSCDKQTSKHQIALRGQHLLESGELVDCKFIVGQKPQQEVIEGHKLLLAMASPVFKAMFYGSIPETANSIPIPDVHPETFKTLLKYIYTDKVELKSFELTYKLIYCSEKYMLQYLVEQCVTYLSSHLSPHNVCEAYELAKLYKYVDLETECLNMLCNRTSEVLKEPSWEEVELDTLLTIFKQNDLNIVSEIELLAAAERWAKAECKRKSYSSNTLCLRKVLGNALSEIRFMTLTPEIFAKGIESSLLLRRDEAFAIFMNISMPKRNTNITMPKNFSTRLHGRNQSRIYRH
ncbi:BTB/POZ domain-containing protein 6-B-like [Chelonus insularis]|uniref:BTB/POZ domain-containing protein 6-B-like n=1 Tax=Chelonus insularis TaxID=460826 RepID=UPI00158CD055|nr:BTB/POZ domain-containing protein 6-B-like [Chelonus insularis]